MFFKKKKPRSLLGVQENTYLSVKNVGESNTGYNFSPTKMKSLIS